MDVGQKIVKISDSLINVIFPKYCVSCDVEGEFLCDKCRDKIIRIKSHFCPICNRISTDGKYCSRCKTKTNLTGVVIATHYQNIIKKAIAAFKYEYIRGLDEILASFLISSLKSTSLADKNIILVPVPIHSSRRSQRGYNQSELLCKKLINHFPKYALRTDILTKHKNTLHQVQLTRKERLENMKKAFSLKSQPDLKGKTVILVDDVYTTGSTLSECAKVLKTLHPKQIWGLVLSKH